MEDIKFVEMIESLNNKVVIESFLKTKSVLKQYKNPYCCISGGKDSDVMLDIIHKVDDANKVNYVFFDTGIEYQATKEHLDYLEDKYNIVIDRIKAVKPIPISCKEYGQPFLSKRISEMILRLQRHNFTWEDNSYENLIKQYPKCVSALKWWCCSYGDGKSQFDITRHRYLKEFLMLNPPKFKISNRCCKYAKKEVGKQYEKENKNDLCINGIRRAEGGARQVAYKSCFDDKKKDGSISYYRPLFWFNNDDIEYYDKIFNIKHSDCYEVYGLKRTGCVGCPYGRNFKDELEVVEKYEPKLLYACNNLFKDSYEYTQQYRDFVKQMKQKEQ